MSKSDKQAVIFICVILIAVGFVLGYLGGGNNVKPEIIEKEVIKTEYVIVENDTPLTPADT